MGWTYQDVLELDEGVYAILVEDLAHAATR